MAEQSFHLLMIKGPTPGKEFKLPQGEISIGRESNNIIVIEDRGLSRRHARMRYFAGSYILVDLGSTNGTFVNDTRLVGEHVLKAGDRINLGEGVTLVFEPIQISADATVFIAAKTHRPPWRRTRRSCAAVSSRKLSDRAAEHRALFSRWFEQLWNLKNYAITQELVDPGFTAHGAGGQDIKQGPDGVAELVKTWHKSFPDGRMTMDDIITEGEYSVIRMTFTGTHQGDFYGIPASNKSIKVTSIGIDRVVNGKITEGWGELDMLGMMQPDGSHAAPAPQQKMFEIDAAVTPEHVAKAYAALGSGDINRIRMYWADEMVWQVPGHNRLSGWYYSLDEFLAFMGEVGELSGHSFNMQPIAGQVPGYRRLLGRSDPQSWESKKPARKDDGYRSCPCAALAAWQSHRR